MSHIDRVQRIAGLTSKMFAQAYPHISREECERIAACAADMMAFELSGETLAATKPSPKVRQDTHG